jgi:DEAD/DEAH box helicase domain-containing protein
VPEWVREGYQRLGVPEPWAHQVEAMEAARSGHSVIATATGSGKSLALWAPVLAALDEPYQLGRISQARSRSSALYLAPTKALAADQLASLQGLIAAAEVGGLEAATCDGDTPRESRQYLQAKADIILTNPDFLHFSLLPGHARWSGLLRGLRYVILDELHAYRGVIGAHVAWVMRRLRRLGRHYGADPLFLAASATVSEPELTLSRLIGADPSEIAVISHDTAARGQQTFVLWRPSSYDRDEQAASRSAIADHAFECPNAVAVPHPPASPDAVALPGPAPAADALSAPHSSTAAYAVEPAPDSSASPDAAPGPRRASPESDQAGASDRDDQTSHGRRSAPAEAARLLARLTDVGARSVVFVRSRYAAESVANAARELLPSSLAARIATYRGGYLAEERRDLERRLRSGALLGLVSTTALELGVDVAGLDAVVTAGWPGTRVALRQQAGRAGRADQDGLAVWVAGTDPLDSYLVTHPEALVGAPLEATVFDPANPYVAAPHLAAAAAEWPLEASELPGLDPTAGAVVERLVRVGALRWRGERCFWVLPERATDLTDLRGSGGGLIQVVESSTGRILGTVDSARAPAFVHPGAIYLHQGESFLVTALDLEGGAALVEEARPRYRTMPLHASTVRVVEERAASSGALADWHFGIVDVTSQVTGFMRLRLPGLERIDTVKLDLPPSELRTAAAWMTIPAAALTAAGLEADEVPAALHAAEHVGIGLLGLLATCDRWDLGGLSTAAHPDTGEATVFIHDSVPGGAGFTERAYQRHSELLRAVRDRLTECPCEEGCPSCVQSPKCGNANQILSKRGALALVTTLTGAN